MSAVWGRPDLSAVPGGSTSLKRLVYLCDWLPPDFGAVGQYAMLFAREWAEEGWAVTLVGLTSGKSRCEGIETVGNGTLEVIRVCRRTYEKHRFTSRVAWTLLSNLVLLRAAFGAIWGSDAILFTGSPPLMLHFIAPLNILLRKRLIYRITDFHPECLVAEKERAGFGLALLLRLTQFWRRRVDAFEALGVDQIRRLVEGGIPERRIRLKRDPSPVSFPAGIHALAVPDELRGGAGIILYSGNWGIAHDAQTFIDAYATYLRQSEQGLRFWLNAVGSKADYVERELRSRGLPIYRSRLVSLEELPRLLTTVDVHLITLRNSFVGYVLPSKVHACVESGKRILFVGNKSSDVHLLASNALPSSRYHRVDVGNVDGLVEAMQAIERALTAERACERFEATRSVFRAGMGNR
jgi:hypothetical protein